MTTKQKKFGKIVQKLRKQTTSLTQEKLNDKLGLPEEKIQQIEQGRAKGIAPDLLVKLANEFNLTTLERKEFFFAAIAVDDEQIAVEDANPQVVLGELVTAMKGTCIPTFINDVYGDVVAANNILLEFLNVGESLQRVSGRVDKYNMMRYIFEDNSIYKQLVGKHWRETAIHNMTYFRRISLRYMAEFYYDQIFEALISYKSFEEFWKLVPSKEFAKERERHDIITYIYTHPIYGPVHYVATGSRATTTAGELYYVQYVPADDDTHNVFTQLKTKTHQPCEITFLAPWPDKPTQ